jgi:hypothetical protein
MNDKTQEKIPSQTSQQNHRSHLILMLPPMYPSRSYFCLDTGLHSGKSYDM